ncbi:HCL463Cp [Eremothecium sinecaudum]|uniref:MMS19 nucleotide excision repair protein n=1 Tax=Eremothecium sinecaudum TaxID=45286 RepID=A0A109UYB4_9SACH|nr:HCL463Cp [Eremothecium sinecaudum]AMD19688.1 HCL463Cp [Eremothecium sinecaudum]
MSYTSGKLHADIMSFLATAGINEAQGGKIAARIANAIASKNLSLLDVVISLREYMTSDEDVVRVEAMGCLSGIFKELDVSVLSKKDVQVMFEFYKNRMDDIPCLKETFTGIRYLVCMKGFSSSQLIPLLKILNDQYQPRNHLAAIRYIPFEILDNVIRRFGNEVAANKVLNDTFIETFISIASGEKDPKNLLLSFRLNTKIGNTLSNIDGFKEDLFDILFCYFPITFKPPADDPYKISNDDLKLALRNAICATPNYAEDAFSNLVEKISASSPSVKDDALLTLKQGVESFPATALDKNWVELWQALKFEIMNSNDVDDPTIPTPVYNNYDTALSVLGAIAKRLLDFDEASFDKFYSHVFEELKPNFAYDRELKQSCGILSHIAAVDTRTFDKVMDTVLPLFFNNAEELDIQKQRLMILNLSFFFDAYITVFGETGTEKSAESPIRSSLMHRKDEIIMVLSKALTSSSVEVSLRTLAIIEFTKLIKMRGYLTKEEIYMVVEHLTQTILTDGNNNIYMACLEGLKIVGKHYEDIFLEMSLKPMLDLLPDKGDVRNVDYNGKTVPLETILKVSTSYVSCTHKFVEESITMMVDKLSIVAKNGATDEYYFLLCSCLHSLFDSSIDLISPGGFDKLKEAIHLKLFTIILNNDCITQSDHNLILLSRCLMFLNLKTSTSAHQEYLDNQNKLFINNRKILEIPDRSAVVFLNILASIDKKCQFEVKEVLQRIISLLRESNMDTFEKLTYLQMVALLVNKWCSDEDAQELVNVTDLSKANIEIIAWLTKGLVMRNSPLAIQYLELFVCLLETQHGSTVTPLFEVLVLDLPIFRKFKKIVSNHNARMLYKQKLFNDIARKLVSGFKMADDMTIKNNYLTSLSLILRNIPTDISVTYIEELLPLLLQALNIENSDVRASSLKTLMETMQQASELMTGHVETLIMIVLKLFQPSKFNNTSVRLLSLQMLKGLAENMPINYLIPLRETILSELVIALGDKKRLIRKQAIDTRQTYFELGHKVL